MSRQTVELAEELKYEAPLEDQLIVSELLKDLSDEERKIVVLSVYGGYKGEEIAKLLKKPHSTVRSKYRRALKKLEEKLKKEEMQHERS